VTYEHLPTPSALVERPVLLRNAARMKARARSLGVELRPHVKTHKCVEAARLQTAGWSGAITVSTLAEARAFAARGFLDITYAVPIAPVRMREAVELSRALRAFHLLVDGEETVAMLEACAAAEHMRLSVFLKVDCGYGRAGVDPGKPASAALAVRIAASPSLTLAGLLTHAGHAYHCRSRAEIAAVAAQERDALLGLAIRLRAQGVGVPVLSVGSTPTVLAVDELAGITEVRPGNYVFFDAFQAAIGSCTLADCAFTVLASVIGTYDDPPRLLIDAGALALSKDPGPTQVDPTCGFGQVFSPDLRQHLSDLRIGNLSQEHGVVTGRTEAALAPFRVGSRLRIVPNHSCLAAALFDRYRVVEEGVVLEEWQPVRGW
jgi:D-serine deaminase-like pyridoxal phosphate-dependent protein